MDALAADEGGPDRAVCPERHEVGPGAAAERAALRFAAEDAGRTERARSDGLHEARPRPRAKVSGGAIERQATARETAIREAHGGAIVVQPPGSVCPRARSSGSRLDPVGDEDETLALCPGGHPHHVRVDVSTVADQVAGESVVGEGEARNTALAVVEAAHGVEEVRHVAGAARNGALEGRRFGQRVADRRDDPAARERLEQLRCAFDLGREGHEPSGPGGCGEQRVDLGQGDRADPGLGLGAGGARVDPRALEMNPDRLRAGEVAGVDAASQRLDECHEVGLRQRHRGREEGGRTVASELGRRACEGVARSSEGREDETPVIVKIEEARRQKRAGKIHALGLDARCLGRCQQAGDPPIVEQERPGDRRFALGIEQGSRLQQAARHACAVYRSERRLPVTCASLRVSRRRTGGPISGAEECAVALDDEIGMIESKLNTLRLDYDQYFIGNRPREPVMARAEVQKLFTFYSQMPIQNTALRFKFNSLTSRFFALKRQWDETLRKIEEGTYKRHLFKADLHERERRERDRKRAHETATAAPAAPEAATAAPAAGTATATEPDLFESYRDAMKSTGQDVSSLTRERLAKAIAKQETALRAQLGCDSVRFRVVVEEGKARLKATPVGGPKGAKPA